MRRVASVPGRPGVSMRWGPTVTDTSSEHLNPALSRRAALLGAAGAGCRARRRRRRRGRLRGDDQGTRQEGRQSARRRAGQRRQGHHRRPEHPRQGRPGPPGGRLGDAADVRPQYKLQSTGSPSRSSPLASSPTRSGCARASSSTTARPSPRTTSSTRSSASRPEAGAGRRDRRDVGGPEEHQEDGQVDGARRPPSAGLDHAVRPRSLRPRIVPEGYRARALGRDGQVGTGPFMLESFDPGKQSCTPASRTTGAAGGRLPRPGHRDRPRRHTARG